MIAGKMLVQRVYERASRVTGVDAVYVATDHVAIRDAVLAFGGHVIMTPPGCPSGTDRVAAAAEQLRLDDAIILNVQGDEPLVEPDVITKLIRTMEHDSSIAVATPIARLTEAAELTNPNIVKVALATNGNALYFSRQAIPYIRDAEQDGNSSGDPATGRIDARLAKFKFFKHIGLYAFRMSALSAFVNLPESRLERAERLEQLRLLEAGIPIRTVEVQYESQAVDTAEDVLTVERLIRERGLE